MAAAAALAGREQADTDAGTPGPGSLSAVSPLPGSGRSRAAGGSRGGPGVQRVVEAGDYGDMTGLALANAFAAAAGGGMRAQMDEGEASCPGLCSLRVQVRGSVV